MAKQTLDVCGFRHEFILDDRLADRTGNDAEADKADMKVTVSPTGAHPQIVQRTVHEGLHILDGLKLLPACMFDTEEEEDGTDCLASLITALVLRNRWLFEPLWKVPE